MTDTEIIKALECCLKATTGNDCEKLNCPALTATGCVYLLSSVRTGEDAIYHGIMKDALDLINRQKEEIERLKEKNESLEVLVLSYGDCVTKTRAEAIREFAERLKEEKFPWKQDHLHSTKLIIDNIDALVKEMTEDSNE